jgi:Putative peptidoglycan binding domain
MTGQLTMYDAISNSQFPAGAQAYAAYVDGGLADQPNYPHIVAAFPRAQHLSIALNPADDADCLDIENGAAAPYDFPDWHARQVARGVARPCGYASASTMELLLLPLLASAGIPRASVRLWSAHYGAWEHICGPSTCNLTSVAMDGTQWTNEALGRDLDQSVLLASFFGTLPPAPGYTEFDMSKLAVLQQGASDKSGAGFWSVHRLQVLLAETGKLQGVGPAKGLHDDGEFGPATAAAVKAVQAHYGITQDAVCGSQTWSVLLTGAPS